MKEAHRTRGGSNLEVTNEHTSSTDFLADGLTTSDQLFTELLGDVESKQLLTSYLL